MLRSFCKGPRGWNASYLNGKRSPLGNREIHTENYDPVGASLNRGQLREDVWRQIRLNLLSTQVIRARAFLVETPQIKLTELSDVRIVQHGLPNRGFRAGT